MQIFDYTDGRKGRKLADVMVAESLSGFVVVKNDVRYKVELVDAPSNWTWHTAAHNKLSITPEAWGVDAICFCIGEVFHTWYPGHPEAESEWEWVVIGTTEWNREACRKGILRATPIGPAFKEAS